jgi:hypothetical protein
MGNSLAQQLPNSLTDRVSILFLFFFLFANVCAYATPPLSGPTSDVWKRDINGNVVFASAPDDRLAALCIEVAGVANWIPHKFLRDIEFPNIDDIHFVRGMGLDADEYVPNWGSRGLSLALDTFVDINGKLEDGPSYYFVIQDSIVLYRVKWSWVPVTEGSGNLKSNEVWIKLPQSKTLSGRCQPPI